MMDDNRKYINRRKRKARRLFKKWPIFAVEMMKREGYEDYNTDLLFEDLPIKKRSKKKEKKRKEKKNTKYRLLASLREEYRYKRDIQIAIRYNAVARSLHKPYTIRGKLKTGEKVETQVSNHTLIYYVKKIMKLIPYCSSPQELDRKVDILLGNRVENLAESERRWVKIFEKMCDE